MLNSVGYSHIVKGESALLELYNNKVFTDQKDFTLSNIRELYMDGDIIINPDYQRDYVYNNKQASKLIESIIMGIPISSICLSEEEKW